MKNNGSDYNVCSAPFDQRIKNGTISRDEYVAMSTRMFERADTNKDGLVLADDPAPPKREREQERSTVSAAANP
jgi:hypothetical protein